MTTWPVTRNGGDRDTSHPSGLRHPLADGVAGAAEALAALRAGLPVLVTDDMATPTRTEAVLAGCLARARWTAWMVRYSSGVLCVALDGARADHLDLPMMVARHERHQRPAYTISVDATRGVSTGISAADRSRTARVLADPGSGPADLIRPGHLLPVVIDRGGVLTRAALPEAAAELCDLAGLPRVALTAELVADTGPLLEPDEAKSLAARHDLVALNLTDVVRYRLHYGDYSDPRAAPQTSGAFVDW